MRLFIRRALLSAALALGLAVAVGAVDPTPATAQTDPLPSWNEGSTKSAIIGFVRKVTEPNGKDFIPGPEWIAVFDNDGTLWPEKPLYFQLAFAFARIRELARVIPALAGIEPYRTVLSGDPAALGALGHKGLLEIVAITHAGMSTTEFERLVRDWLVERPYTELVYQPMLELLAYLRANGFKTYIVSGGRIDFMRPWVEAVYGIPSEQVVGSSIKTEFRLDNDRPVIDKLPEIDFVDNGPRFALIVHHTDAEREWSYDRALLRRAARQGA